MWTVKIDDIDFTLFFDIDQLKDNKIARLSNDGKIQWFKERCFMLMVRPVTLAFEPEPVLNLKEKIFTLLGRTLGIFLPF